MHLEHDARSQQTRELELELARVRSSAEAARLEARAAELELLIRRLSRADDVDLSDWTQPQSLQRESGHGRDNRPLPEPAGASTEPWSDRLARAKYRDDPSRRCETTALVLDGQAKSLYQQTGAVPTIAALWAPQVHAAGADKSPDRTIGPSGAEDNQVLPTHGPLRQHALWNSSAQQNGAHSVEEAEPLDIKAQKEAEPLELSEPVVVPAAVKSVSGSDHVTHRADRAAEIPAAPTLLKSGRTSRRPRVDTSTSTVTRKMEPVPLADLNADDKRQDARPRRRIRPASWVVSTLAHVAVLILFGIMTHASKGPKDQLAFTASAAESSEESMETFEIQSSEPQESEPTIPETAYDVSAIGTMAVAEVTIDIPEPMAAMSTAELLSSSSSSSSRSMMKSLKSDSKTNIQFCGVDGGGNHFVYLVDSSGSMQDGFQSARTELLASIDQLKADQRFYVVFFDEDSEYMRIRDPNADEPASVAATAENKQRLRKWAMMVQMNRGKAPYEVLPFALSLRPDVIFLLSDGEFPARIGDILREQNHQENLFGDSGPISIVHTIRYHGIEGETGRQAEETMMKIAKENGGQYRYVPKPK